MAKKKSTSLSSTEATTNSGVRRFELVEGTASKFWEVSQNGSEFTVRFGQIGTAGQAPKTTDAGSPEKAAATIEKLIQEKTGKGYAEVGGTTKAAPSHAANKTAPTAVAPLDAKETKAQLAKVKKLITANSPDSFALAVELLRTLGADEATWLDLLSESRVTKLFRLDATYDKNIIRWSSGNMQVFNLLLEAASIGPKIRRRIFEGPGFKSWHWHTDQLTSLSDTPGHVALAQELAKHKYLKFSGLTSLSDAAAAALAKHKSYLYFASLTSLSDAAAAALGKHQGDLCLHNLTSLSDTAAAALAEHKGPLAFNGLKSLSDAAAAALAKHQGDLCLGVPLGLSDAAAAALAKHEGKLWLNSLTSLSDAAAAALGKHQGHLLLHNLTSLSDTAAAALAEHEGDLNLSGLESLSDVAAAALAKHKGPLDFNGLRSLSDTPGHVALSEKLAKQKKAALLNLKSLSDAAAAALAKYKVSISFGGGLTSLSDAAAMSLSKHKGELYIRDLNGLPKSAAAILRKRG